MSTTTRRIGRYLLGDALGRGAMGVVFRAEDPFIHRTVAVKVLHSGAGSTPHDSAEPRERFRREAQAAGSIDHPNVVRIFDVGEEAVSGEMYLVMEYVPGPSLERMLGEQDLELTRGVEIIGHIAAGLDAAHAKGIIHRDIKPANILFTAEGAPKIADFGITRIATSSLTQDMRELGSPAYMSPEQVVGKHLDSRADLFSLGVVGYEMLVGRKPFEGNDVVSMAYAIAHSQPLAISVANPGLPRTLDAVFDRVLAKKPNERFASGRAFHEALLASLPGADSVRKPARSAGRTRRIAAWGAAGLVGLAVIVAGLLPRGDQIPAAPQKADPPAQAAKPSPKSVPKPKPKSAPPAPRIAAAPAAAATPAATVSISLAHRIREGTLVVSLDGVPILNERFSKSKLAILQTTTWDSFKVPAGTRTLKARVSGDGGRTYESDPVTVNLSRVKESAFRIGFKGDSLIVKQTS